MTHWPMVHSDTNDRSGVNDLFNMPGLVSHTADDLVEDVNKPDGYFNGFERRHDREPEAD